MPFGNVCLGRSGDGAPNLLHKLQDAIRRRQRLGLFVQHLAVAFFVVQRPVGVLDDLGVAVHADASARRTAAVEFLPVLWHKPSTIQHLGGGVGVDAHEIANGLDLDRAKRLTHVADRADFAAVDRTVRFDIAFVPEILQEIHKTRVVLPAVRHGRSS